MKRNRLLLGLGIVLSAGAIVGGSLGIAAAMGAGPDRTVIQQTPLIAPAGTPGPTPEPTGSAPTPEPTTSAPAGPGASQPPAAPPPAAPPAAPPPAAPRPVAPQPVAPPADDDDDDDPDDPDDADDPDD